jgi:anion-transporting  ArsA/GET3 family ATPase
MGVFVSVTESASLLDPAPILGRRLHIVAGKGGVGKSTVSAALALVAARRGKRVLVVELGAQPRVGGLLGYPGVVGYEPVRVRERIDVINVTPGPAMHEYGLMKLRFERLYRLVFENPIMHSLTRMIPGMNELVLIGKTWFLEQEKDERGQPKWDMLIVDAPATGHGVSLLALPHVITETVTSGPMAEEVGVIKDMLTDGERTAMSIVTLAEEMPVRETLDLRARMLDTLRIAPGYLFVNGLYPDLPSTEVQAAVSRVAGWAGPGQGLGRAASFLAERRRAQEEHLALLSSRCDLPQIRIPYLFTPEFGPAATLAISEAIDGALSPGAPA